MVDYPNGPKKGPSLDGPSPTNYTVGFRKPPEASRFKPGKSGNPKGRPKGVKNTRPAPDEEHIKSIVFEEAYRTIPVNDGGRRIKVPVIQAVLRSMAHNALKGNNRAANSFANLVRATENHNVAMRNKLWDAAIEYKHQWEHELYRRKQLRISGPEPIPHPDHVVLNFSTRRVEFTGPVTKEDQAYWNQIRQFKKDCDFVLGEYEIELLNDPLPRSREDILQDIEEVQGARAIFSRLIPD